jgi:hemolysin III
MGLSIVKTPLLLELEDRANGISHAIGVGAAIAGLGLLATLSAQTGDPWKIVSSCIYGSTLVILFAASTLYHTARSKPWRRILRLLDHAAIPLLIAGTYTPFLLVNIRGPWGWSLFGAIWTLAVAGVAMGIASSGRFKAARTILYLLMGWLVVVAMPPLSRNISTAGLWLLVSGGIAYTLGTAFYALDRRLPYGHMVWHVFVLGASVCHFLSITLGVLPYGG